MYSSNIVCPFCKEKLSVDYSLVSTIVLLCNNCLIDNFYHKYSEYCYEDGEKIIIFVISDFIVECFFDKTLINSYDTYPKKQISLNYQFIPDFSDLEKLKRKIETIYNFS